MQGKKEVAIKHVLFHAHKWLMLAYAIENKKASQANYLFVIQHGSAKLCLQLKFRRLEACEGKLIKSKFRLFPRLAFS